jgi:type I restriction enzyme M protein
MNKNGIEFSEFVLFSEEEVRALDARVILRDSRGKQVPYVTCLIRDKEVQLKSEERTRQLWLARLIDKLGYARSRIAIEYPITFGRDSSKRADIVVFDADRPTVPYIIVEVKQAKYKDGKEQLRSYAHATGAPLAVWSDGILAEVWHRKNPNYFMPIHELPRADQTIEQVVDQPWSIQSLIDLEEERVKEGKFARSLRDLIEDMEDEVLANAGVDVFEEVFKLIFTKLYDEMTSHRHGSYLRFRNQNTAAQLKVSIQNLFDDAKKKWPGVFLDDERIRLSPDHLQVCVGSLEEWKLFNSNLDVIDDAFEYLVSKSSKGEKGQYFTPRWVIDMCVKMMNPKEGETVIDTACGSAGFTVHSMFHVWRQIMRAMGREESHLFTMEAKPNRCIDYVRDNVFAIDFDEKSVRVSRCLNLIAGDGETNVLHLNTLDWTKWDETAKQNEWLDTYGDGWRRLRKLRVKEKGEAADSPSYRSFGFDVLMANPPFAGDIRQSDMLAPYDLAAKANGKRETAVARDLLFVERNLDFLRPGGRMAVVLPQGRFNNSSDKRMREFIMERCRILAVVGLHPNTFKPHTGTKTSVLLVQKWNDDAGKGPLCPKVEDYDIFFAAQQVESVDNSGRKVYRRDTHGNILRDDHGHFIVEHDLFRHDAMGSGGEVIPGRDGIAEAFEEFARKEGFSFFRDAPSTKTA